MSDQRKEWIEAYRMLDAIRAEREAVIKAALAAAGDLDQRYRAAIERMEEIADALPEHHGDCLGCSAPIFEGDAYSPDVSGDILCEECSPTYADMVASPGHFMHVDDEGEDAPMTAEQARAIADAHVAAGGSLDDKMVIR